MWAGGVVRSAAMAIRKTSGDLIVQLNEATKDLNRSWYERNTERWIAAVSNPLDVQAKDAPWSALPVGTWPLDPIPSLAAVSQRTATLAGNIDRVGLLPLPPQDSARLRASKCADRAENTGRIG
jgi:hypothetical protein